MTATVAPIALPLRVGRRTLWRFERPLLRRRVTLEEGLAGGPPALDPLPEGAAGYQLLAWPVAALPALKAAHPRLRAFLRQTYARSYADLGTDFETYLAGFSAKSRSTLRRKVKKLEPFEVRCFRLPEEIACFHRDARTISARSYQEQRLNAGLPDGPIALADMQARAALDAMRGWILYLESKPVSYLYAPAEGGTLLYAWLGYDPDHAQSSPGTVLQYEAMRQLLAEGRFRRFDFTEGDGQHKRLWGTGTVECADLLLLRRTPGNLLTGHVLNGFDRAVTMAKAGARALRLERVVRKRLG